MRDIKVEIEIVEGKLRGTFWAHEKGKESYGVGYIEIKTKKEFPKFKEWIDKITTLLEETAVELDEGASWGDYSLGRVEEKYEE